MAKEHSMQPVMKRVLLKKSYWLFLILLPLWFWGPEAIFGTDEAARQAAAQGAYVCPMHPDVVSDSPGACRICGMALVARKDVEKKNVAILIFNGVEIIDYAAPYEIFGQKHLNVYTVAGSREPVTTSMNMSVNPQYTVENAPKPFVVIVPGGDIRAAQNDPKVIDWIRNTAASADYVLSVCNGAFLLNNAGLLHGLSATTFHGLIRQLKTEAPDTKVVSDKRYVDNGKIITTAGLSSGIDGSLYLLSKIYGMDEAKTIALHLEYNWQPDSNFARAAMADKFIPDLDLDTPHVSDFHAVRNLGGMDTWELDGEAKSDLTSQGLLKLLADAVQKDTGWKLAPAAGNSRIAWKFADEKGQPWGAVLTVTPVAGKDKIFSLALKIDRATTGVSTAKNS